MISYDSLRDKMKEKGISQYALIRALAHQSSPDHPPEAE